MGGIPLKWDINATLDDQLPRLYTGRSELVQRLLAEFCQLCGSHTDVEVHHVRAMKKLHEYKGRPKPAWVKRMIALKRKTLLLCKRCHEAVDHGLPITWSLISLDEIKNRRKRSMTRYLRDTVLDVKRQNIEMNRNQAMTSLPCRAGQSRPSRYAVTT